MPDTPALTGTTCQIFLKHLLTFIFFLCYTSCATATEPPPYGIGANIFQLPSPATKTIHYANDYLQLESEYNSLFGVVTHTKLTKEINTHNAVALEWDFGRNENREGVTWGASPNPHHFFKFTGERLAQRLSFNFLTGAIQEMVPQYAYGVAYKYAFPKKTLSDFHMGFYRALASSQTLTPIAFTEQGNVYTDYRRIAGATSAGANVGFSLMPSQRSAFHFDANYDQLHYNVLYQNPHSAHDQRGFGASISAEQLLSDKIKIRVTGSRRSLYDDYSLEFSRLPQTALQPEISLITERIISHNQTPTANSIRLGLKFNLDGSAYQNRYRSLSAAETSLSTWTNEPAVHMASVVATIDERVARLPVGLSSLDPDNGNTGITTTLHGSGFTSSSMVTFDGIAATSIMFINSSTLRVVVPAHPYGPVDVVVTNPGNNSVTLANGFFYHGSTLEAVTPDVDGVAGGATVTLYGDELSNASSVTFGGVAATNIHVIDDHYVSCTVPAHAAGTADVTITTPLNISTLPNSFTYLATPSPTLVNANVGGTNSNTAVTISGSGFLGAASVTFGGTAASNVVVVNDTTITCSTPTHAAGTVDVVVSNAVTTGTVNNAFTYLATPVPNSVNANVGGGAGNTSVTITGSGFTNATGVTFGGTAATSVSVVNDTTITCVTPAHAAGTVNVVVSNAVTNGTLNNGFTYLATPAPTSVSPNIGVIDGGTSVTISGSGFTNATGVTFGGTTATNVSVVNDTTITCVTPAHAAGAVNVVVSNAVTTGTLNNGFTYYLTPAPTSVSPNVGGTGGTTSVTISGSGFTGATGVTFGGTAATSVSVVNDTTITCVTPAHTAGAVNIVVTNPATTGILNNGFTYLATPAPTSITPNVGSVGGNTSVTITGSGFTNATGVTFGGTTATSVSVVNDTTITCVTPAHTAGAVNVVVTNPATTGTLNNGFTYLATPAPTSVTPNVGGVGGSTSVTISGSGFTNATSVTFGGTAATSVSVVNDTTITCITPAHAAGAVNVAVSNAVTNGTLNNGFTYLATPAPTNVSPNVGSVGGSTSVTISGSGFTGATGVTFGGTTATSVSVVNDTTITCVTPAHTAGAVNIVVTNPATTGTLNNGFTYLATPAPTSITPNVGGVGGNTSVTITGSGFTNATGVTFGGTAATSVSVVNDTTITCVTPAHAAGAVNVVISNAVTNGTLNNGFTYLATPAPTSVSPNVGVIDGGTSVTISGSGFTNATGVTFGGTAAASVSVVNDTTITCVTPAHVAGAVNVVVSNAVTNGTLNNGFTYYLSPAPTSVTPNVGGVGGNTSVTISGSGFTNVTGVTFGGTAATSVSVVNDTTITCVTPAHTAGAVNVVVTNPATTGTLNNGFTYLATPAPTSVTPNVGGVGGSTSVTISGSGFTNATGVTFGGTAATSVSVVNDTTITCITPAHAAGAVNVVISNAVTNGTLNNGFTYLATPAPSSVSPNVGVIDGGTSVTISGSGFTNATGVTFGGTAATSVSVVNDTTITCVTPAHAAGAVNVVISNAVTNGTLNNGFTYYVTPAPTSVSPNVGITGGSTSVTISGSGFTGVTGVTFGGTAATSVSVVNDSTITCVTPAHTAGAVNVVVSNPATTGTLSNGFTYYSTPAPTSVSPNVGGTGGTTSVTISGSGFTGTTGVTFGGNAATSVSVVNNTTITCVTPAHAAGAVDVVVSNPATSGTLSSGFTYLAAPSPTSVSPNSGTSTGGTLVTITGTGFTGASGVTFGGVAATLPIVVNDTTMTCVTPAHTAGAVNVVVTNAVTNGTLVNGYTYLGPAPTSVSANSGGTAGGTLVTITGTGFTGATGVTFGGVAATLPIVVNDTTMTCVTPAHAAGAVDVVVSNTNSSGTLTNGFTYYATPAPSSVSPTFGTTAGGTSLTITGTGFTGATGVTFGGTAATSVVVVNNTTITCVTPAHTAGAVNVVVTNPVTSGTLNNGYTYYGTPAPTSVVLATGLRTGGIAVTVNGSGFTGATVVTFGGTAATSVVVVSDTVITCVTPAHAAGAVNVVVSNPLASGTLTNGYTFL